jgi:hypothetical protein
MGRTPLVKQFLISVVFLSCVPNLSLAAQPFALVELFTSEGCSSCPPADQFISQLQEEAQKEKKNIYILGLHVSYWNDLGWEDPFSNPEYDLRQQIYGQILNTSVYTPQMVINGEFALVGNDRTKALNYIHEELKKEGTGDLKIDWNSTQKKLHYKASNIPLNSNLNIAIVESEQTSQVLRGENKGETLHHINIVRRLQTLSLNALEGDIELTGFTDDLFIMAFIQDMKTLKILAATSLEK